MRVRMFRAAALLCFAVGAAFGQAVSGSIQGTAMDQSEAIVPGVKVTARNLQTGLVFTSSSNETGLYLLAQIPPGTYEVAAEKAGFAKSVQQNVLVRVNDQVRVDFKMTVGQIQEQVNVSSQAP